MRRLFFKKTCEDEPINKKLKKRFEG